MKYYTEKQLSEIFSLNKNTVCRYKRLMESSGLYPGAIIGSGRGLRIEVGAFQHYLTHKTLVDDENGRKYAPRYCGGFRNNA